MEIPIIFGIQGTKLSKEEADFFRNTKPFGFILFTRNLENPDQVRKLIKDLKDCADLEEIPILIDEEGGSVQRLPQTFWETRPSAKELGLNFQEDPKKAMKLTRNNYYEIGLTLKDLGISVNAAPVFDIQYQSTHEVIGDRSFGSDPYAVSVLGRAAAEGLKNAGVIPIMKHIPGHGRTTVDSHFNPPVIDASLKELRKSDFIPFQENSDLPFAMTGHVQLNVVDPNHPTTLSSKVIEGIIRDEMQFQGLLISDCLFMDALPDTVPERVQASLKAGCDLALHCHGNINDMKKSIVNIPPISSKTKERWHSTLEWLNSK